MIKWGNHKLGPDTCIINMGAVEDCPSKALGLCKIAGKCYAKKPEVQYKEHVVGYRNRQKDFWLNNTWEFIADYIVKKIKARLYLTKYLRFNESGDFWSQQDVTKLSNIAGILKTIDVITYGYTARRDLDFNAVHFLVKGSGFWAPNGRTMVLKKNEKVPEDYIECPGTGKSGCYRCNLCKINIHYNIAFHIH